MYSISVATRRCKFSSDLFNKQAVSYLKIALQLWHHHNSTTAMFDAELGASVLCMQCSMQSVESATCTETPSVVLHHGGIAGMPGAESGASSLCPRVGGVGAVSS